MKRLLFIGFLFCIVCLFFYKTILRGLIPFPGDLLLSGYGPWRHVSYNDYVAGAIPSKDQYFDVIRELYPWKTLVIQEIKQGKMPLWNPYNFSGSPLLANYQSQVFYPLSIFYYIFPQIIAWTILIILQPFLGSVFMYLFATEIGLSSTAGILSAILFNFSSFASVWMEFNTIWHTILWLPLLLFLFERGLKQKMLTIGQKALFIFSLFSAITAGHPQDFLNCFLFLIIYIIVRLLTFRSWTNEEKFLFISYHLPFIIIIPFLLAAPQLLPTIELFKNSARVAHDYEQIVSKMLVQWWQLPLLVVSDFFGNPATKTHFIGDYVGRTLSIGVVGFSLVIATLVDQKKCFHKTFFFWTAIAILLITVNTPITQLLNRYPIPIMSTGTPTRILFLLMLAFSILAGFGFDSFVKQKKIVIRMPFILFGIFVLLWLFALLHPSVPGLVYAAQSFNVMKRAMLFSSIIFSAIIAILVVKKYSSLAIYLLIALSVVELLYSFTKFNPFVPSSFVFPENSVMQFVKTNAGIYRYWGYGTAAVEANFATQTNTYSLDGTDPLNLKWYNEFIQASRDGNIAQAFNRTTRSDAQLAPGYGTGDLPSNIYRLRLMDLLGVKYIINRSENPISDKTFSTDRFKPVWQKDTWTIFENLKVAPRFFLTTDVKSYMDTNDFERKFFSTDNNFTIFLRDTDFVNLPKLSGNTQIISLLSYSPTKIEFLTDSDGTQVLFLSDTYDPGWTAKIDEKKTTIYKANWAFRAIVVPPGNHKITFIYFPKSFTIGLYISFIGVACLLIFYRYEKK